MSDLFYYESGKKPTKYQLLQKDLCVNVADKIIYAKDLSGNIIEVSGISDELQGDILYTGDGSKSVSVEQVTGLNTQFGFRNKLINGSMEVQQYQNTNTGSIEYITDRWQHGICSGTLVSRGVEERTVPYIGVFNTGGSRTNFMQMIEYSHIFRGRTVTVSADVVGEMNVSPWGRLPVECYIAITDGSNTVSPNPDTQNVLYEEYFYRSVEDQNNGVIPSITFTLPNLTTSQFIGVRIGVVPQGNNYGLINDVQIELGEVATPFERRPYEIELALCERYYSTGYVRTFSQALNRSGWAVEIQKFPTTMRVTPSIVSYDGIGGNGTAGKISVYSTTSATITNNIASTLLTSTNHGFSLGKSVGQACYGVMYGWRADAEF